VARLLNLIRNENMKIYRRPRTWVLVGILLFTLIIQAAFLFNTEKHADGNWKEKLQNETTRMELELKDPGKLPEFARKQVELEVKINRYAIDHNLRPDEYNTWRFTKAASGQMQVAAIFVLVIAADIVASEFTWGTIKLLLIRPASRTKILLSKYLATLLFALFLIVVLWAASFLIGGLLFGFGGAGQPYVYANLDGVHETTLAANALLTFALSPVPLILYTTLAFMISAAFRSSTLAITLSLLLMFGGQVATQLLGQYSWAKYILFTNLDLMQYFEGIPSVEGMTLPFSVSMLAIYFLVMNAAAWLLFKRRDVAA
jgi:ABC-2 type transport system permease protein